MIIKTIKKKIIKTNNDNPHIHEATYINLCQGSYHFLSGNNNYDVVHVYQFPLMSFNEQIIIFIY